MKSCDDCLWFGKNHMPMYSGCRETCFNQSASKDTCWGDHYFMTAKANRSLRGNCKPEARYYQEIK